MRYRLLPLVVLLTLLSTPLCRSQELSVTPYNKTGVYELGDTVGWTITLAENVEARPGNYGYSVKKNNLEVIKSGELDFSSGKATIEASVAEPAMLYVTITPPPVPEGASTRTPRRPTILGAAIAPTKLQPSTPRPADFAAFWESKIKQLKEVPENAQLTPKDSGKPNVEYATIQMDHIGGVHVHGQIAKPKKEGKFPALVIFQWASPPYPLEKSWVTDRAAEGWLTLNIEPHDVLPDQPKEYYQALPKELKQYQSIGNDDRDKCYFLQMYLADYRAIDYIAGHPDWDGKTLVAMGTSMGGQQSLCVAGLHPKITHVIVNEPAGCDTNGPLHGRQSGYPNFPSKNSKVMETALYFDAVNFAQDIKVPSLVAMGFIDTICPPAGIWTAFNQIKGPKLAVPMVDSAHNHQATPAQQRPYTETSAQWLRTLVNGGEVMPDNSTAAAAAAPATTQEPYNDHRHMMNQLGVKALRRGADPRNQDAFDEATANPYKDSMPDALTMSDGAKVTMPEQWPKRRAEIVELFEREIYGRIPNNVPKVTWEVTSTTEGTSGGIPTITKNLVGHVDNSAHRQITVDIQASFTVPADATQPVPMMIVFGGLGPRRNRPGPAPDRPAEWGPPWTEQAIAKGWGYGTIDPRSIQPDSNQLRSGIIGLTNRGEPRKPDDWGALRAWQWGVSRLIDYFETHPDSMVDAKKVGIEGLSRYGKAALVTQAFDERVAVGLIGSSGAGGVKLYRHIFGEAVENLASGGYYWFAGNFIKYAASEATFGPKTAADLPIDSHQLIALCAPRPCFISYGIVEKGDAKWVDARGSFMAGVLAGPVYRLLGKRDLGTPGNYLTDPMPPLKTLIGGELAWRQHEGGHDVTPNWPAFFRWVGNYIQAPPLPAHAALAQRHDPVAVAAPDATVPSAARSAPRTDANSKLAHEQLVEKAKQGRIDVYFVGDSITRRWGCTDRQWKAMLDNWNENFFGWNAANFGWGADKTENILWRLQNGELDGVNPKIIVVHGGTNNVGTTPGDDAKAAEVAQGIKAILDVCQAKAPDAVIVLTAIFPRNDNIAVMPTIDRINANIAKFADGKRIRFLNVNDKLADADGKLLPGMMGDKLHPTVAGYQVWADGLKPIFTEILGPPAKEDRAPPPTGDPSAKSAAAPTKTLTNSIGVEFVLVPAGDFMMGSAQSKEDLAATFARFGTQPEHFYDEYPQHKVRITRPFYLGKHEVTIGQFRRFLDATGFKTQAEQEEVHLRGSGGWGFNSDKQVIEGRDPKYNWRNPGYPITDDMPVANVTYNDVVAFCEWLSKKEGKTYRLPTEAEWEFACRAGTNTQYFSGDDPESLAKVANIADAEFFAKYPRYYYSADKYLKSNDGQVFPARVGSYPPNAFGLHDMHGNVWEWTSDWHEPGYYANSPTDDPQGPPIGRRKARRGGAWHTAAPWARAAYRNYNTVESRYPNLGFRLVLTSN